MYRLWAFAVVCLLVPTHSAVAFSFSKTHLVEGATASSSDHGLMAVSSSELLHLSISQTVMAPTFMHPPRLPKCIGQKNISELLVNAMNSSYGSLLSGDAQVDTTLVQRVDECTYNSLIRYQGSPTLKWLLVHGRLCQVLKGYCEEAFPTSSGYTLAASAADADPALPPSLDFNCTKHNFTQRLDHFNPEDTRTFDQVYWLCGAAWPEDRHTQERHGIIIVFLGNESPLGVPQQPLVFENARRLNALVLEVEHRYYGDSVPFPKPANANGQLPTEQYKWLTLENVIEDTAAVLAAVRERLRVPAAVPAIVIGGSYGGMLASYHRVVKPHIFAAAIASSAPNSYIFGTPMWAATAENYHARIAASADVNSGSKVCSSTVRLGMEQLSGLIRTASGRKKLAQVFKLCGDGADALPTKQAGFAFLMDQYGNYHGYAQTNNQPSLLGQMELACNVLANAVAGGADALQAVAAVNTYFSHNGSDAWCYKFNYTYTLLDPSGLLAYSYQWCTQGPLASSGLPSDGSPGTLTPAYDVHVSTLRSECESLFGPDVPEFNPPAFAKEIRSLVKGYRGIVFTNGELDGWAGGSYSSYKDLLGPTSTWQLKTAGSGNSGSGSSGDGSGGRGSGGSSSSSSSHNNYDRLASRRLAFVVYKGGSHCTDVHNPSWNTPDEPAVWQQQRALAMDYAVKFTRPYRETWLASDGSNRGDGHTAVATS